MNGCVGDTFIWVPKSSVQYIWGVQSGYEVIYPQGVSVVSGLLWCHFHALKKGYSYTEMGEAYYIPALEIAKLSYAEMCSRLIGMSNLQTIYNEHLASWDEDKKYITQEFIERYCHPIRDFFIKK